MIKHFYYFCPTYSYILHDLNIIYTYASINQHTKTGNTSTAKQDNNKLYLSPHDALKHHFNPWKQT